MAELGLKIIACLKNAVDEMHPHQHRNPDNLADHYKMPVTPRLLRPEHMIFATKFAQKLF